MRVRPGVVAEGDAAARGEEGVEQSPPTTTTTTTTSPPPSFLPQDSTTLLLSHAQDSELRACVERVDGVLTNRIKLFTHLKTQLETFRAKLDA